MSETVDKTKDTIEKTKLLKNQNVEKTLIEPIDGLRVYGGIDFKTFGDFKSLGVSDLKNISTGFSSISNAINSGSTDAALGAIGSLGSIASSFGIPGAGLAGSMISSFASPNATSPMKVMSEQIAKVSQQIAKGFSELKTQVVDEARKTRSEIKNYINKVRLEKAETQQKALKIADNMYEQYNQEINKIQKTYNDKIDAIASEYNKKKKEFYDSVVSTAQENFINTAIEITDIDKNLLLAKDKIKRALELQIEIEKIKNFDEKKFVEKIMTEYITSRES